MEGNKVIFLMRWGKWKKEVFHLMKTRYASAYSKQLLSRDIDWVAWRELYDNEYLPADAVNVEISYMD